MNLIEQYTKCPFCRSSLKFPLAKKERVRLAKTGDLIGACQYHDRIPIPWDAQLLIAPR
jgi:hypothetical protein